MKNHTFHHYPNRITVTKSTTTYILKAFNITVPNHTLQIKNLNHRMVD
ncbi:hypothetical protein AERO9A_300149 [Aeromonas salmonicida]|nr:hypothetical protein AERO9A_300149 [Aeromonas salmonicida]